MQSRQQMQFRQGDVFLVEMRDADVPADAKEVARDRGRVVLAYGEVTGHAHAIHAQAATLFDLGDVGSVLRVTKRVVLRHEEHAEIELPPANYRVVIQREYQPGELPRQVVD